MGSAWGATHDREPAAFVTLLFRDEDYDEGEDDCE
jgi:hypothetical protein